MGFDYERARWLVGLALARSSGDGSFRMAGSCESGCAGEIESALTGLYPYARYAVSEKLSLWSVIGHARGDLTYAPEGGSEIETDAGMSMTAAGARGVLLPARVPGAFELALRADLLFTSTDSDAAPDLAGTEAETSRARLLLKGSRALRVGDNAVLTPSLEMGLRYDGGDAESGSGLEIGGSLRYAAGALSVEVSARGLLAHAQSDYQEWGVRASVVFSPGEGGQGLSLRAGSAWGASSGGAEQLWSRARAGVPGGDFDPGTRLDAEVAYGFDAPRALLTPYLGLGVSETGDTWRAGARWRLGPAYKVSLEASLTEPAGDVKPESGFLLRGSGRW